MCYDARIARNANNTKESNMPQVAVDTSEYEASHWQAPRGNGCWAWYIGDDAEPVWINGVTYAQSRRAAVVIARHRGADVVKVGA
jgi:hypothetical protein